MARDGVIRVTADIPTADAKRLAGLAASMGSNKTTALVKALRTSSYLEEAVAAGSRIEIVDKDGTRREIVIQ
jgi:hypothetical protein